MQSNQYTESVALIALIRGKSGQSVFTLHYANDTELPANMRVLHPFLETEVITCCDEDGSISACVIQRPNGDHIRQDGNFRPAVLLKRVRESGNPKDVFLSDLNNNEYSILTTLLIETQVRVNAILKDIPASND